MRTYSSLGVEKYIAIGFLSLILAGTLLLWGCNLLFEMPIPLLDALFLSTSAVCVTGLAPFDPGSVLALPSQMILLVLVQLGGIGIMTATTTLLLLTGQRLRVRDRLFLAGGLGVDTPQGAVRLLRVVLLYTLSFEAAGTLILFLSFARHGNPLTTAFYQAVFHAVSAFCNAGFSLYSTNLEAFSTSFVVPGVIMLLIIFGGIGFPVVMELTDLLRGRVRFFSAYTKIVLYATFFLIVGGACLITLTEWNHGFADLPVWARLWNGLFGSVTARTAGFDMVHYAAWSPEGLMVTIFLMLIGASPSSTGGGLKTTTFVLLLGAVLSELRQEEDTNMAGRRMPPFILRRALALAFVYLFTLFIAISILSAAETQQFGSLVFEAVSALGTVGLSRGITPELSNIGKVVLILLMYWGRIGIFTFFYSIIPREPHTNVRFPDANIPIG